MKERMDKTMTCLIQAVNHLVQEEAERAKAKHGTRYASIHEAYGVLAEEVQEAKEELAMVTVCMDDLIGSIHKHWSREQKEDMGTLQKHAMLLACEAIQVAAVCVKAKNQQVETAQ